jgi:hypothetical protein
LRAPCGRISANRTFASWFVKLRSNDGFAEGIPWISEEAGPAASIDALMGVAAYFKLDTEAAVKILTDVERTVSNWRVRGRELGMSAAELDQFADAFEHRAREVAQSIVRERRG